VTGANDVGRAAVGAFDGQPAQATSPAATGPPLTVGAGVAVPLAAGADPDTPGALAVPLPPAPVLPVPVLPLPPPAVPLATAGLVAEADAPGARGEEPAVCELTDALAHPAASTPAASSAAATAARDVDRFSVIM